MNIKTTEFTLLWLMPGIAFGSIALLASYKIGTDFNHHWLVELGVFLIILLSLLTVYGLLLTTLSDIFFSQATLPPLPFSTDNSSVLLDLQGIEAPTITDVTSDTDFPIHEIVSTCLNKSALIQSDKRQKAESDRQRRTLILVEYANVVLTNHMSENQLETILKNVELFAVLYIYDY